MLGIPGEAVQGEQIGDVLATIRSYSPDADQRTLMSAYLLAAKVQAVQTRKSGEAYLTHPLAVAKILADMRMDVDTIATALLHDALEDNPMTKQEMTDEVGPIITELVDGVTKIGKLKFRSKEELQAENFRKMMLAMARDVRVILVKLADRLHNMRTLEHHRPDKQVSISQETLDIYVPIANRLGIERLRSELEDYCFRYLHPEEFAEVAAYLERTQNDRQIYARRVALELQDLLRSKGVEADVKGRAKARHSIYKKMVAQGLEVHQVPDLLAFRALVPDVGQCYAALGHIHASFAPVPDRIKDYIARAKPNGYQSLHTTVIGPDKRRIEVQIRTPEMHRIAEEGIAAHWRYKEGHLALSRDDVSRIARIRDIFESVQDADNATDFMESVKGEFYAEEVFGFTPAGDVKQFRQGATVLDFAYAIHTDVGTTCTGARVNGRIQPLRYELKSGDTIEVLTHPSQSPTRDWLKRARTGRALSKIRRSLREQEQEQGVRLGRDMLDAELKKRSDSLEKARKEGRLKTLAKELGLKDVDAVFLDIARGQLGLADTAKLISGESDPDTDEADLEGGFTGWFRRRRPKSENPVLISGEDGVLVNFAGCCSPLPGEAIVGFITRGRGITVHQATCAQVENLDRSRVIAVQWDANVEARLSGSVRITCSNNPGLLASISKVCEQAQININRAEVHPLGDDRASCTLELSVRDLSELTRVIANLERIRGVEQVERVSA